MRMTANVPRNRSRRSTVRTVLFSAVLIAVLIGCIGLQRHTANGIQAERNRLFHAVLVRMTEENERLHTAITSADTASVIRSAEVLSGYASLTAAIGYTGDDRLLCQSVTDTGQFYEALSRTWSNDTNTTDPDFWERCTETLSDHLAVMALSLSDRQDPASPTEPERRCAHDLAALCVSFYTEKIRIPSYLHPGYRFAKEGTVTQAEARTVLRGLIGQAASFLTAVHTDEERGLYLFSCQNGYAEVSQNGGHLLSYAFYPRSAVTDASVCADRLTDDELSSAAAAFLKKAAIPLQEILSWEDRHGIRTFTAKTADDRTVTVGIRVHDGCVMTHDAEAYYRK